MEMNTGGNKEMNDYEEELVDVEIAIQRMAMLRCIFSENLPHLSEQIMEDMLTIKTFIERYCDDKKEVKECTKKN